MMFKLKHHAYFFSLLCLSACGPGVVENNQATQAFRSEDFLTARETYIEALLEAPGSVHYRYNLAIANTAGERLSDALKELSVLESFYKGKELKKEDYKELFKLYFATAFIKGLTQNYDQALEYYQKALNIDPESLEVKKNIELLISQKKSQKNKDGKPSEDKKKGGQKGDESENQGDDKKQKGKDKNNKDAKGQDDETLKKKNLSKQQIEQILKEIKDQEGKVRAKENQKNKGKKKGRGADGKTW